MEEKQYSQRELVQFEKMTEEELAEYPGAKEQLTAAQERIRAMMKPMWDKMEAQGAALKAALPKPHVMPQQRSFISEYLKLPRPEVVQHALDARNIVKLHPDTIQELAQAIAEELKKN